MVSILNLKLHLAGAPFCHAISHRMHLPQQYLFKVSVFYKSLRALLVKQTQVQCLLLERLLCCGFVRR